MGYSTAYEREDWGHVAQALMPAFVRAAVARAKRPDRAAGVKKGQSVVRAIYAKRRRLK